MLCLPPAMISGSSIMARNTFVRHTSLAYKCTQNIINDHNHVCDKICQSKDSINIPRRVHFSSANVEIFGTKYEDVERSEISLEDILFPKSSGNLSLESTIECALNVNISESSEIETLKKPAKHVRFSPPGEEEIIHGKNQEVVEQNVLWYTSSELSLARSEARSSVRAYRMVVSGHIPLDESRICVRGLEDYASKGIRQLKKIKVEEAKRIVLDRQHDTNEKEIQLCYSQSSRWALIAAYKLAIQDAIDAGTRTQSTAKVTAFLKAKNGQ